MNDQRATTALPPLVQSAMAHAERASFTRSCTPEVGRLLRTLAAAVAEGVIAELGAGYGVGAGWIASGLRPGATFVTIELEPERAAVVTELLANVPNARVEQGDWRVILRHAPFALLFVDAAEAKHAAAHTVVEHIRPGGIVVLDDLTPEEHWPPKWRGHPDPVREFWLNDPRLLATELLLTPTSAAIVATRR